MLHNAVELLHFVGQYAPIPRPCIVDVERPLREGCVLAAMKGGKDYQAAVHAARECHRRILAMYRTLSAANSAALLTTVFLDGKGVSTQIIPEGSCTHKIGSRRCNLNELLGLLSLQKLVKMQCETAKMQRVLCLLNRTQ